MPTAYPVRVLLLAESTYSCGSYGVAAFVRFSRFWQSKVTLEHEASSQWVHGVKTKFLDKGEKHTVCAGHVAQSIIAVWSHLCLKDD